MNQLSQVVNQIAAGFELRALSSANVASRVDDTLLQVACIDLISRLENHLAKSQNMSRVFFIDESARIARETLVMLHQFCDDNLGLCRVGPVYEQIDQGLAACDAFEEVLKTRSLSNAIMRTFWKAGESGAIETSHTHLGQSLVRACATTLHQAIVLLGPATDAGKLVDETAAVFCKQLEQSW